ncbi:MAG: PspC domain-containing protein [Bacteroidales bacterium]|nr:PspC domain-containing protein [Bacteroidales bacterium]
MKRVTNACIGGRNFTLEEDAYNRLAAYLEHFRSRLSVPELQKGEVMEEIESRISDLFFQDVADTSRVVTLPLVERVTSTLGMPDGSSEFSSGTASSEYAFSQEEKVPRKLFRDMDNKAVAGVCSGLGCYFEIDVTIIRIIMLVALLAGTSGFWIYVVLWIAVPKAETPAQKCEMRGIPATAENMARFAGSKKDSYKR